MSPFRIISLLAFTLFSCEGSIEQTIGTIDPHGSKNNGMTDVANGDDTGDPDTDKSCASSKSIFEDHIWSKVVQPKCVGCHVDGGAAMGSSLIFTSTASASNFEAIQPFAQTKVDGRSVLELKALNELTHGGGEVLKRDGTTHKLLVDFVGSVDGTTCVLEPTDPPTGPYYSGVKDLDDDVLLRRLTLALASRVPTDSELARIRQDGSTMPQILDGLFQEKAFIDHAMDAFGDILLTDGYEATKGAVLPSIFYANNGYPVDYIEERIFDGWLRREPVELIGFIIRNDRPFTEILTADYTVVSTYTRRGYGIYDVVKSRFKSLDDHSEYIDVKLPGTYADGTSTEDIWKDGVFPHSGVLSTWMWTARFLSTETNRNRGRAREFYRQFLNIDLLEFAPLSNDTAAETAKYEKPLINPESTCYTCHVVMDPVAGLFQNHRQYVGFAIKEWDTSDIEEPGFEGEEIPREDIGNSLQWLAERVVTDERFKSTMVNHAYYVLTQEHVLLQPRDTDDPLFGSYLRAYEAQKKMLDEAVEAMEADNFNIKAALKSMVASNWFRAGSYDASQDPEGDNPLREVELGALGISVPVTPEQFYSRLNNLLGHDEIRFKPIRYSATLRQDSYMAFGGVNHRDVIDRPLLVNPIMGAMVRQIANEVSCNLIPKILIDNKPTTLDLFPFVDKTNSDESAIRKNLVHLHWIFLGEHLTEDSIEVNRTYKLFSEVVQNGKSEIAAGNDENRLAPACRRDLTGPSDDPDYIIRGWGVMFTFFLRHPKFILQ